MLGAGEVVGGMIDVDHSGYQPTKILLNPQWINQFIGIDVSREEMVTILEKIGCQMKGDTIIVPSFRKDLEHKADIAEEIARFYGYDKIPSTAIRGTAQGALTEYQKFERTVRETLLAQGCYEISTYSFISPKYYDKICLPADSPLRKSVVILNPLGEDTSVMRTIVIPSMMEILSKNYNNRNASASLFELSNEYIPVEGQELPDENPVITIGQYGGSCDFFSLKGIVENLLMVLGVSGVSVEAESNLPYYHPGRCAKILLQDRTLGTLGEIHPQVAENYGIDTRVYVARLDCRALFENRCQNKEYHPLPKFPATTRDLALLCDDSLPVQTIENAIRAGAGKLLERIDLFDVYKGKQIPEGKKSVAYNITMRSPDRTLTDEDVAQAMEKILNHLSTLGVSVRQ